MSIGYAEIRLLPEGRTVRWRTLCRPALTTAFSHEGNDEYRLTDEYPLRTPQVSTARRMGHDRDMTARWGVAGPGPVADKVLRDLAHGPNAVLTAVGSRSAERAEAFAAV